ncbi:MAG: CHAD domain-containing protein [Planctomycetota bacterium]
MPRSSNTADPVATDLELQLLPAAAAARSLLKKRFKQVIGLLPLAAEDPDGDIEHVHRLRVATRRAGAALAAFSPLMERKPSDAKKALRNIRRAAGPARDADVLWLRLAERAGEPFVDRIAGPRLRAQRDDAQRALCSAATKRRSKRLRAALRDAVALLNSPDESSTAFGEFAGSTVEDAADRFRVASQADLSGWHELHQLRIAGKRLRYTLELFDSELAEEAREAAASATKALQNRLGAINDHATAQAHYQRWIGGMSADADAALLAAEIVSESARAEALATDFHAWWAGEGEHALAAAVDRLS